MTVLSSAELYDPVKNTWSTTGSMSSPRDLTSATMLPSGKVLVSAGSDGTNWLASATVYEPTGWTPAAYMSVGRAGHTATPLNNGKVLVSGGSVGPVSTTSTELYNPTTNAWSSGPSMSVGRAGHTATLLGNGKVLVAGGYSGSTAYATTELYNPSTNTWSSAASMSTATTWQDATLLGNGKLLTTGGISTSGAPAPAELYDPVANTWSSAGSGAPVTGLGSAATLLGNGKVLVTGGSPSPNIYLNNVYLYDPTANSWGTQPPMSTPRAWHTATLLGDGSVLVAGGTGQSGDLWSSERFVNNMWSAGPNLLGPRTDHVATLLTDGDVLVAGGSNGQAPLNTSEFYDPTTGHWISAGTMNTVGRGETATLLGSGKVLVAGGASSVMSGSPGITAAGLFDPYLGFPAITGMKPSSAAVGTTISITGRRFTGAMVVRIGGVQATFTVASESKISATVPSGALNGPVSVTTPVGTAWSTAVFGVRPKISSFSPTSGPVGTTVTVVGSAFTGATKVQFNGVAATSFTVKSYTKIVAKVPSGATTGHIAVTTAGGKGTSATSFSVT